MSYLAGGKYLGSGKSDGGIKNSIVLLALTHVICIWGIKSELYSEYYYPLIPLNMLLCLAVLLYHQKYWNRNAVIFLVFTFAAGFAVQTVGAKTGYPFGPFKFGWSLGPKLWGTPVAVGAIWLIVVYCCGMLIKNLSFTLLQKASLGGLMVMLFDIVLEPIARQYKMWDWFTKKDPASHFRPVPLENYASWFAISFLLFLYFFNAKAKLRNPIAPAVIIIFILYLVAMHIIK